MVLAVYENGEVAFSGLHQNIFMYRAAAGRVEEIETNGMWIGIMDDIDNLLQNDKFRFEVGDTLLLYTDGITEARDQDNTMFSEEKLKQVFEGSADKSTAEIEKTILSALDTYQKDDDVTFVIAKRLE